MNTSSSSARCPNPRFWSFLAAGTTLLASTPAWAAAPLSLAARVPGAAKMNALAPLLAETWVEEAYDYINNSMGTRQGMMMFASIGMLIALFVIWYRR